jgi:hypothetical protein
VTASERSFVYGLDAVRQRAQHRLDAAAHHVSSVHRTLLRDEEIQRALLEEYQRLAASMTPKAYTPLDPRLATAQSGYLANLWRRIKTLDTSIDRIRSELTQARNHALARSTDVEVFERHREEQLRKHVATQTARSASDADQDWLARSVWRSCHGARSPAVAATTARGEDVR